jgi:hypothetical protein
VAQPNLIYLCQRRQKPRGFGKFRTCAGSPVYPNKLHAERRAAPLFWRNRGYRGALALDPKHPWPATWTRRSAFAHSPPNIYFLIHCSVDMVVCAPFLVARNAAHSGRKSFKVRSAEFRCGILLRGSPGMGMLRVAVGEVVRRNNQSTLDLMQTNQQALLFEFNSSKIFKSHRSARREFSENLICV